MKSIVLKIIVVALTVFTLASCAKMKKWDDDVATPPVKKQFYDTRFYLNGLALNGPRILELRRHPEDLNETVRFLVGKDEDLARPEKRGRLKELLAVLDRGQGFAGFVPPKLRGLEGFQTRLALRYAVECTDNQLKSLGDLNLVGKIEKWIYEKERRSGYIYWEAKAPNCDGVEQNYRFHVAVDGSYVEHKNLAKGYELYFPKLGMELPEEERQRIRDQKRRFDYKLHAEGESIVVLTAFVNHQLVDASDPIYERTEDSCIDVLFRGRPPATELPKQEWYCMGRCDNPPLINTGGT